jgi:hypothetical protein
MMVLSKGVVLKYTKSMRFSNNNSGSDSSNGGSSNSSNNSSEKSYLRRSSDESSTDIIQGVFRDVFVDDRGIDDINIEVYRRCVLI